MIQMRKVMINYNIVGKKIDEFHTSLKDNKISSRLITKRKSNRQKNSKRVKENQFLIRKSNISKKMDKSNYTFTQVKKLSKNKYKISDLLNEQSSFNNETVKNTTVNFKEGKNTYQFKSVNKGPDFATISFNQLSDRKSQRAPIKKFVNNPISSESHHDLVSKIMKSPSTIKLLNKDKDSKNEINFIYPKEIHTSYTKNKKGSAVITINKNHPTKKMILDKLMTEKTYNDLINQQDKIHVNDPLGLYLVLKNIQKRRCSEGYICVEIGNYLLIKEQFMEILIFFKKKLLKV